MKAYTIALFFSTMLFVSAKAPEKDYVQIEKKSITERIKQLIVAGNSKELSTHFDELIDLRIDDEKTSYSREQAVVILDKFFTKYPASDFKYVHRGQSQGGNKQYTIGEYTYSQGVFVVFILMEKLKSKNIITLIDFEEKK